MERPAPPQRRPLPIDGHLGAILASLEREPSLVLEAPPGTGKTTRVPPALLGASWRRPDDQILVLEPRRLAAKLSARFVAEEKGERVGETVGYQFRFENVGGPRTRLRYLTEGTLVRWLLGNPTLRGVSALVLDEFHERHVHTDTALAYARWLQTTTRPDLRVIVMSATLDAGPIAAYLGGCPRIAVEGRVFPVDIRHRDGPLAKPLEQEVRASVSEFLSLQPSGDALVFLPGMGEIRRAESALAELSRAKGLDVLPLHGELTPEEQDRAVKPGARRKVILSTNVAETSLTIEGVTAVIDSGLHRRASHSWWSGLPALKTRPISRASAIQRAGRAGRTAPGVCLRLYTLHDFNHRPQLEVPELHRTDLAQTVLELKGSGLSELSKFPWFEPPPSDSLGAALELLYRLGALTDRSLDGKLTDLGRRLASLPVGPRFARVLLEAQRQGIAEEAVNFVASRLGDFDPPRDALSARPSEPRGFIAGRVRSQLLSALSKQAATPTLPGGWEDRLAFSLLTGFPDRVGRKREPDSQRSRTRQGEAEIVLGSGGAARVADTGAVAHGGTFVVLEAQERQRPGQTKAEVFVECLAPIHDEWLFDLSPVGVEERAELSWDGARKRVTAATRLAYDQLVLEESQTDPPADERTLRFLLRQTLGIGETPSLSDWMEGLGKVMDREAAEALFSRIQILHQHFPEKVPSPAGANLFEKLAPSLKGVFSLSDLKAFDWPGLLSEALCGELSRRLDSLVPDHVTLSRGRRVRVQYRWNQTPWIESRMQDFFGMRQGPALLDGRLPLTLHLLAPNQRAVQVTSDLSGFWTRHYPDLRKTLKIRYPKHAWPENPLSP
jgi:ATP-dependent helicase HrpB